MELFFGRLKILIYVLCSYKFINCNHCIFLILAQQVSKIQLYKQIINCTLGIKKYILHLRQRYLLLFYYLYCNSCHFEKKTFYCLLVNNFHDKWMIQLVSRELTFVFMTINWVWNVFLTWIKLLALWFLCLYN